jgi:pyridoxal phosphate enzyme (YggS family)
MIRENILRIENRILSACSRVKRERNCVALLAVSKNRSLQEIAQVIQAGVTDIAENRVQEALLKIPNLSIEEIRLPPVKWHMIGHLQSNKAKDAVKLFGLIHSVDSLHLAVEIDKQAARIKKAQDILLEIKTSLETTKSGFAVEDGVLAFKELKTLKNLRVKGLMTIAPLSQDPQKSRPYFRRLRQLLEEINATLDSRYAIQELSMGMSDDFEVAIEEGATIIRVGRAIFQD